MIIFIIYYILAYPQVPKVNSVDVEICLLLSIKKQLFICQLVQEIVPHPQVYLLNTSTDSLLHCSQQAKQMHSIER